MGDNNGLNSTKRTSCRFLVRLRKQPKNREYRPSKKSSASDLVGILKRIVIPEITIFPERKNKINAGVHKLRCWTKMKKPLALKLTSTVHFLVFYGPNNAKNNTSHVFPWWWNCVAYSWKFRFKLWFSCPSSQFSEKIIPLWNVPQLNQKSYGPMVLPRFSLLISNRLFPVWLHRTP